MQRSAPAAAARAERRAVGGGGIPSLRTSTRPRSRAAAGRSRQLRSRAPPFSLTVAVVARCGSDSVASDVVERLERGFNQGAGAARRGVDRSRLAGARRTRDRRRRGPQESAREAMKVANSSASPTRDAREGHRRAARTAGELRALRRRGRRRAHRHRPLPLPPGPARRVGKRARGGAAARRRRPVPSRLGAPAPGLHRRSARRPRGGARALPRRRRFVGQLVDHRRQGQGLPRARLPWIRAGWLAARPARARHGRDRLRRCGDVPRAAPRARCGAFARSTGSLTARWLERALARGRSVDARRRARGQDVCAQLRACGSCTPGRDQLQIFVTRRCSGASTEGTRHVIAACRRRDRPLVARRPWSRSGTPPAADATRSRPTTALSSLRLHDDQARGGRAALAAQGEPDVVASIPGAIFGPGARSEHLSSSCASSPAAPMPFAPPGALSVVGIDDVVDGILLALVRRARPAPSAHRTGVRVARRVPSRGERAGVRLPRHRAARAVVGAAAARPSTPAPLDLFTPTALRMLAANFRFDSSRARSDMAPAAVRQCCAAIAWLRAGEAVRLTPAGSSLRRRRRCRRAAALALIRYRAAAGHAEQGDGHGEGDAGDDRNQPEDHAQTEEHAGQRQQEYPYARPR